MSLQGLFFRTICNRDRLFLPVLIVAIVVSGCTARINVPHRIVEHYPIEKQLESKPLRQLEDCIGIIDVGMVGPYLICKEHKTKYHFTFYDSEFRMVGHWGHNGRGPGEYIAPIYYGQYEKTDSSIQFCLWERSSYELHSVDIIKTDSVISMQSISRFKMPRDSKVEPRVLVRCGMNSFFGVSDWEDCCFFTSDSTFSNPHFAAHVLPFDAKSVAHEMSQSCYGIKPDKSRIAIAYFCLPQIDIRTADGEIVQTIFLNKIIRPQDLDLNNRSDYFYKAVADDQFIYTLCDAPDSDRSGRNNILVFDWDGNPVAKYSVLRASSFAIDKQTHRLITINMDQTNSLCSIYSM